jgi:hypothetical protein
MAAVVGDWTGIPVGLMARNEIETILKAAEHLGQRVIGQDHAMEMIAKRIQTSRAGLRIGISIVHRKFKRPLESPESPSQPWVGGRCLPGYLETGTWAAALSRLGRHPTVRLGLVRPCDQGLLRVLRRRADRRRSTACWPVARPMEPSKVSPGRTV